MSTVYVRWYGNVVQGELLDGVTMGMLHVRIPLDGRYPIALFMPEHVYQSAEQIGATVPKGTEVVPNCSQVVPNCSEIVPADTGTGSCSSAQVPVPNDVIEAFKQANWDHERGHLRIDKLDDFYQLWRMAMVPFGYVEGGADVGTGTLAVPQEPVPGKPVPKVRRHAPKVTQLSIFD